MPDQGDPMTEQTPADHSECRPYLMRLAAEIGTDVVVSLVPPIVAGPYRTEALTCPHGTTFYLEPTGEQIAEWARDGVK